jgi:signal transduction histidine kinase
MLITSLLGPYLSRFNIFYTSLYRPVAFYIIFESVVLQTVIIYLYGGIEAAGLLIIYLVVIHFAGLFSAGWPYITANVSSILLSMALWAIHYGWLKQYNYILHTSGSPSWEICLVATVMLVSFFNLSAALNNVVLNILRAKNRLLRQYQQEIVRTEKMAALGRLAADIAHEIRNPLSILQNQLHTLPSTSSTAVVLERAFKQIERIKNFVKRLLIYSRAHKLSLQQVPLEGVMVSALEYALESAQAEQRITVERRFSKLPSIVGDTNLLQQCFINLFTNAIEAINGEGKITVELGQDKDGVCVKIQDTGKGIPEEDLERIFEPFYSAKASAGEGGTGLGLAIVKEVIANHGGTISVKSRLDEGTTFVLHLPVRSL